MDRAETLAVMTVLQAAYPNFYKGMAKKNADEIVDLWTTMFADDPAELVAAAVKTHIATDEKGFPPHIGAIKAAIVKLTKPAELEMSELEAWHLVRKAIKGASMEEWSRKYRNGVQDPRTSAEVNFEQLPELLQRLVGSPSQLAAWELLADDQIDTVIQSNFMRSFRARVVHERERLALPSGIRNTMNRGALVCTEGTDKDNKATLYLPDFVVLYPDGTYRIVDTKSEATITQTFKLKMKSLREKFPKVKIDIE